MRNLTKFMLVVSTALLLVNVSHAQGISDAICESHQMHMKRTIYEWRQSGVPIKNAKDTFNREDNWDLQYYLKDVVAQINKDPEGSKSLFSSGEFMRKCLEIHRGY